jgi:hypothetical protein
LQKDRDYLESLSGPTAHRLCAVCHFPFRGFAAFRMTWCRKDRYFVCDRCWRESCRARHGAEPAQRAPTLLTALVILLAMGALFVPFGLAGLCDYSSRLTWDSMETTPIGEAPASGFIKIEGRITSPDGLPFGRNPANWSWELDRASSFHVSDGTGTVVVFTGEMYSYQEPYQVNRNGAPAYLLNDTVQIVGRIEAGSGWTGIHMAYIWPAREHVTIDNGALAGGVLFTVPFGLGLAFLAYHAVKRNLLHARAAAGAWPARLPPEIAERDRSIPWFSNRPAFHAAHSRFVLGLLIALWAFVAALVLTQGPFTRRSDLDGLAAGFAGLNLLTIIPGMFLYFIPRPPDLVGVSARGIHFWHEREVERLLNRDFVAWKDILAMETPEPGEPCRIYLKDGDLVRVDGIGFYYGRMLRAEWQEATSGRSPVRPAPETTTLIDSGDAIGETEDSTSFNEMTEGDETTDIVEMEEDGETTSFAEMDERASADPLIDIVGDNDTTSFAVVDSNPVAWKEETVFDEMAEGEEDSGFVEMPEDEVEPALLAADADEFAEIELSDGEEFLEVGDVTGYLDGRAAPGKAGPKRY